MVPQRLELKTVTKAPKPEMNKTEQRYSALLETMYCGGKIKGYGFQRYTFRLAHDLRYTPDFHVVTLDDVLELHEVKGGFIREDAKMKFKLASEMFPHRFKLCVWDKGQWTITEA